MKKIFLILGITILDVLLKQVSLQLAGPLFLLPHFFAFTIYKNPNLAFSLTFLSQTTTVILTISILIILLILTIRSYTKKQNSFSTAYLGIILGASSNLFDRLYHGAVIDCFYLYPISYFNLADLLIGGSITYLAYLIYKK